MWPCSQVKHWTDHREKCRESLKSIGGEGGHGEGNDTLKELLGGENIPNEELACKSYVPQQPHLVTIAHLLVVIFTPRTGRWLELQVSIKIMPTLNAERPLDEVLRLTEVGDDTKAEVGVNTTLAPRQGRFF
jgi:hypothetical protein